MQALRLLEIEVLALVDLKIDSQGTNQ